MERADFAAWCAAVCRHIRYRPARAQAAAELMDHLTDHAAALEDAGAAPEEAARTALAAMGDAGKVGRALDRAHPPLLCASVALTRACAVLLSVAACLFLLPLLFLSAWDLLIYRPVRSIPREEIVRAAAGDTAARIGNKVVVVTDVVQTRDGTLSVCLLEFNVPPHPQQLRLLRLPGPGRVRADLPGRRTALRELFPPQHRLLPGLSAHGQRDPPLR